MPKIIAHRGASGLAPENTLPAIQAAIDAGADGVEFDVQLSKDGVVVIHHNLRLSSAFARRGGRWLSRAGPPICSLTLAELKAYDVGRIKPGAKAANRYPDYRPSAGATIPTLAEALALIQDAAPAGFELWIELKVDPTKPELSSDPAALAAATVAEVAEAGLVKRSTFLSFCWPALFHVRDAERAARLAFVTAERRPPYNTWANAEGAAPWLGDLDPAAVARSVPDAIRAAGGAVWSAYYRELTPDRLARARALGLEASVWTVRTAYQRGVVERLGPDAITTDRPDWFR